MAKFKAGDRIKLVREMAPVKNRVQYVGKSGEITKVCDSREYPYAQAYNTNFTGIYVVYEDEIELVSRPTVVTVVITTNGVTTTATLREGKRVIRTATSKCSPKDTYDYETGAKLAFNRLFPEVTETAPEPPKPKYYTGKVVCVKSGYPWWTVGKVYGIVDGTITANDGYKYCGYISAEDARHAGRTVGGAPFPGSDAGHNPDNEFIPFVEE